MADAIAERFETARREAEAEARRIASGFGAPAVANLTVASRPLYALGCRIVELETAMDAALGLIERGQAADAVALLRRKRRPDRPL